MAFRNIMIFGAGGTNIGHHLVHALVDDGNFNVSVLARESSKSQFPSSVKVLRVADEFPHDDLVKALQGQDVIICAVGPNAAPLQYRLIDAAIEAGVKRFIPSEWGFDNGDVKNQKLNFIFEEKGKTEKYLQSKESSTFSWTAVATSIWMEWALNAKFIGVDPVAHTAQYWRDGTHRFSNTTLPYSAQATVQLMKNPEVGKNQRIFVSGFEASQQDIVAELEKQQGVKYDVSHEDADQIVAEAKSKWANEREASAPYTLIKASILLPEYKANFVSAGKKPILEELVEMPKLTLEGVVRESFGGALRN